MNSESLEAARSQYYNQPKKFNKFKEYQFFGDFAGCNERIANMEVFDDDIWVTSFPRSGTTFMQEMVWCIVNKVDLERAKENLLRRTINLDLLMHPETKHQILCDEYAAVENAATAKRPRLIKTHIPWDLLPSQIQTYQKRPKIIHVVRNPKDVCVSYYHHNKLFYGYHGDFPLFSKLFLHNKLSCTPFAKTILSYWRERSEPNVLIIRFEDMISDLIGVISKVSAFLNIDLSGDEMEKLNNHLSFAEMRRNSAVNMKSMLEKLNRTNSNETFIRKGEAGNYLSEMHPATVVEFDSWIENEFSGTGLSFL